ncbi:hypothetical protein Bca4012_068678 [Brassica carinata]
MQYFVVQVGRVDCKKTGRSSSTVEVRLLRFWEARNVRCGGELMGVDILLLDSQKVQILDFSGSTTSITALYL